MFSGRPSDGHPVGAVRALRARSCRTEKCCLIQRTLCSSLPLRLRRSQFTRAGLVTTPLQPFVRWAETAKDNGYLPVPMNGKRPAIKELEFARPWATPRSETSFEIPHTTPRTLAFEPASWLPSTSITAIEHRGPHSTRCIRDAGHTPFVRIGRRPRLMLFYRADDEVQSVSAGKVDILGKGKVAVVEGIHPDTARPYDWPEEQSPRLAVFSSPAGSTLGSGVLCRLGREVPGRVRKASSRKTHAALQLWQTHLGNAKQGQLTHRRRAKQGLFRRLKDQAPTATTLQELVVEAQTLNLSGHATPSRFGGPSGGIERLEIQGAGKLIIAGRQSVVLPICKEAVLRMSKNPEARLTCSHC